MIQTITNKDSSFKISYKAKYQAKKIKLELKKEHPNFNFLFYLIAGNKYKYSIK